MAVEISPARPSAALAAAPAARELPVLPCAQLALASSVSTRTLHPSATTDSYWQRNSDAPD